jgi:chemotaxis protein CheD
VRQIGGLLHAVLPTLRSQDLGEKRPTMFVDTGVRYALDELRRNGCRQNDIRCKVFGGAEVTEAESFFRVGANNSHAFCQVSRELGLHVAAWEIGGRANRSICLFNRSGDVAVQAPSRPEYTR